MGTMASEARVSAYEHGLCGGPCSPSSTPPSPTSARHSATSARLLRSHERHEGLLYRMGKRERDTDARQEIRLIWVDKTYPRH